MAKQSLTNETVTGLFWQSSVAGANLVIRTIVLIVLARHLPASAFGIIAAALVVTTVTQVFSQIGVTQALVQRLDLSEEHVRSGFAISLYTGIAAAILLLFGAPFLAALFRIPEVDPIIRAFSILLVLNGIAAVPIALLQRERKFKRLSTIELIAFATGYGAVGLLLTFAGFGVWALAIAQITQVTVRTVAYIAYTRPPMGLWPQRQALHDLFHVGSGFSAGQIGNLVATQVDYFVVGRWLGAEALGLYNRAYQFLMLPAQLFGTAAATVLFPVIASIQDQPERVARAYLRAIDVIAMITLPVSGVLILVAPELVVVTLGDRWTGMIVPFQILIATLLFRTSYKISDALVLALGSMRERAFRQWIYAGAVAMGALIGVQWGIAGASAGVAGAVVLNFMMMMQMGIRLSGVSPTHVLALHVRHALAALPLIMGVAVAVLFARRADLSDLLVLTLGCLAAASIWMALWWRCRWIYGDNGEWAYGLAASHLAPLRRRLRS